MNKEEKIDPIVGLLKEWGIIKETKSEKSDNNKLDRFEVDTKREKKGSVVEDHIFSNYKIRDTQYHYSEITEIADYNVVTVVISNTLDSPVTIKIMMALNATKLVGMQSGNDIIVGAGERKALTITPETGAWLPFLFLVAKCDSAPTTGELNAAVAKLIVKVEE